MFFSTSTAAYQVAYNICLFVLFVYCEEKGHLQWPISILYALLFIIRPYQSLVHLKVEHNRHILLYFDSLSVYIYFCSFFSFFFSRIFLAFVMWLVYIFSIQNHSIHVIIYIQYNEWPQHQHFNCRT